MTSPGNDFPVHGRMISSASVEVVDAVKTRPTQPDRKFRTPGWWPSNGTAARAALVTFLVVIAIAWTLTLLNK